MQPKSLKSILQAYKTNGYALDDRPFAMNIFGIRANSTESDRFDDILGYLYKDGKGNWNVVQNAGTTDTGTYYLNNPENSKGTALLIAGQYKDAYALGMHKQSYLAFRQVGKVKVFRDYNRDAILDFNNGRLDEGSDFGINLHRASLTGKNYTIGKYSAGCQVWQKPDEFNAALEFGKKHKERYGNQFTYTLFDERADFRRRLKYGSFLAVSVGFGFFVYKIVLKGR